MSLLNITYLDFEGKFSLHSGMYEQDKINDYVDRYERIYLIKLLGVDLFNLFVADLVGGIPTDPKYLAIYESFEYDSASCGDITISEGMVDLILGVVYFQYLKDQTSQVWVSGQVSPTGENSNNQSTLNMMMYTRYNDSVRSFKAIQRYICDNSTDYSDFNGTSLKTAYWV